MEKDRFEYVRVQTEQGRDIFVRHVPSNEEGQVLSCAGDLATIKNTAGQEQTWHYSDIEEITRSKNEWPRRD